MAEDLNAECERYAEMVRANPADIQILGIGRNGHIAFNEPYTKPEEPTHIALLTADPSLVPTYALTMGINEILGAKRILLLATGESKAQAVYDMIMGRDDTSCPATALRKHPDVTVILDKEAASLLTFTEWENAAERRAAEASAAAAEEALVEEAAADEEPVEETAADEAADEEPVETAEETAEEEVPAEEIAETAAPAEE